MNEFAAMVFKAQLPDVKVLGIDGDRHYLAAFGVTTPIYGEADLPDEMPENLLVDVVSRLRWMVDDTRRRQAAAKLDEPATGIEAVVGSPNHYRLVD